MDAVLELTAGVPTWQLVAGAVAAFLVPLVFWLRAPKVSSLTQLGHMRRLLQFDCR
jgi:hypothetical protein